jgi:multicomponent Na+:H+ antiporter subunit D
MLLVEQFPVLIVTVGVFAAYTILLAGWVNKKSSFYLSLATISAQLVMAIFILRHVLTVGVIHYWLGGWRPPWGIEYVVDALNGYVLVILLFLSLMCVLYSKRSILHKIEERKVVTFYTIFQLMVSGLCGVVVTGDVFNMYVLFEVASLTSYALIAVAGGKGLKASFNYLVLGSVGICFYLLGVGFLYSVTGSLNMKDIAILLPPLYHNRIVLTAFVFILVGLGIKMALFPLHTWLPDAHSYAPAEISAMLSGIIIEVGTYAFLRISFSVFTVEFLKQVPIFEVISWLAAVAMIYGSILAIAQYNLKRMLAYSSVANMGYIMLGVGLSTSTTLGLTPALMHILNHALMKACMFLVAGAFIYKFDLWEMTDFRGLGRKMPYTSLAFILASLSMIGLPPSVGFVTKVYLALACLEAGQFPFIAVIFFSTLLMVFYFWRVIEFMYIRVGDEEERAVEQEEVPWSMLVPVVVLGLLCFIMGLVWIFELPFPIMDAVNARLGLGVIP